MPTTEQKIDRLSTIVSEIHQMLHAKSKPRWVKVGAVTELTGWTKNKLQWARRNKIIDYLETPDGILYDLNSINENFIKKTS
jgi:hypothetical protein